MILLHARPSPSPVSKMHGPATHSKTEKERQYADGRKRKGTGVEPNHTTARKLGPLHIYRSIFPGFTHSL
jgi:hypothetical protein